MTIRSLTSEEKDTLLYSIRDTKMTLTELLESTRSIGFDKSFKLSFPIITKDAEIIITSFAEHDYYNDGYSFFREQLDLITDKASDYNEIDINDYGLIKQSIYYGCSFESDLEHERIDIIKKIINKFILFITERFWLVILLLS